MDNSRNCDSLCVKILEVHDMADCSGATRSKRGPKPTEKAVEEKIKWLKRERKGKLARLPKQKNDLEILKEIEHNVKVIKDEALLMFERCLGEYKNSAS